MNLEKKIEEMKLDLGIMKGININDVVEIDNYKKLRDENKPLPENIYFDRFSSEFVKLNKTYTDANKVDEYIKLKSLLYLRRISNIMTLLFICYIVASIILLVVWLK